MIGGDFSLTSFIRNDMISCQTMEGRGVPMIDIYCAPRPSPILNGRVISTEGRNPPRMKYKPLVSNPCY